MTSLAFLPLGLPASHPSGLMHHRNGPAYVHGVKNLSRRTIIGKMKSVHGICSKELLNFVNKGL